MPLWEKIDDYHIRRQDGAMVCKVYQTWTPQHAEAIGGDVSIGSFVWLYLASRADKTWAGPPRLSAAEAKADLEAADAEY